MTGNPTLKSDTFTDLRAENRYDAMTVQGAVNKTVILLLLTLVAAGYTWRLSNAGNPLARSLMLGGLIGGFAVALVTIFKKQWSGVTAPLYAILEGLFLGGISATLERQFHGIALQAVLLTFGTLAALLGCYKTGLIKATDGFRRGIYAATGGIALVYLVSFVLSFFNISIPYIHGSGAIGIGFSLVVVTIAAMNLVLDFDFIEQGSAVGAPKYMEWYAAFGLMVTLIWLYLEILRLLSKLNRK